ncbi:MAG TPA: response regulator transcription factor [Armatimonadetes bacterium]|nr:response regulator transcription factor [Armatimonadota bacterium]
MDRVRVLIADDHPLILEGLWSLLERQEGIEVVGKASDGPTAVMQALELEPDVILMDIRMPGEDGVEATRRIRHASPHIRVIILTVYEDDASIFSAIKAGACGYILKDVDTDQLIDSIRRAARGESLIHPAIAARVLDEFTRLTREQERMAPDLFQQLTKREVEILHLLAEGLSNKEIAFRLSISEKTVKNYLSSIFSKLQVNDRMQALIYAFEHNLIPSSN